MAEAVVSVVLETLRDLLVNEARFLSGVSSEVEEIRKELKRMLCFLKDADAKQGKDETVKNWLREIRNLSYRIEDIVEAYVILAQVKKSSGKRGFKKFVKRFTGAFGEIRSLHRLGKEIEKVKSEISNLTSSLQRYDVKAISINGGEGESSSSNQNQQWDRQTYAHEVEEYFVGMENDIQSLMSRITDDDKEHHRIISILGMGGLGKTTLARKVYNHEDVQRRFERFAWTCVTQKAQIEVILRHTLKQLLPEEKKDGVRSMECPELVPKLHEVLMQSKCLVVLDDIWNLVDWKYMSSAFPSSTEESTSKLLMTTRTQKVAELGFLYKPQGLSQKEGWELLQAIILSSRTDFKTIAQSFEEVGMELVSKCGGLPLAVCVLGGILKEKCSLAEWKTVNTDIGSYLMDREENGETGGGSVGRVLSLSFNELPYHLKLCFLCFGNFKEDEIIGAEELYLIWIAEDLVLSQHKRDGESFMEVAESYLKELGNRSMVQLKVGKLSITAEIRSCRLHDVMRDLCLDKGRKEEFIKVIHLRNIRQPLPHSSHPAHRLVIHIDKDDEVDAVSRINDAREDWTQTRSLYLRSETGSNKLQGMVTHDFMMLRRLAIVAFSFKEHKFPFKLGNLIHLRMLSFQDCELDELPSCIADLPLLHTLDLRGINGIRIPNVLWKMKRLRHFYCDWDLKIIGDESVRLRGLFELETLWAFDNEFNEIADLSELVNLRYLGARVLESKDDLDALMDYIAKNGPKLRNINITIGHLDFTTGSVNGYDILVKVLMCASLDDLWFYESKLVEFPSYEPGFLPHLTRLELSGSKLEEDPMETIGQLPQLRRLKLERDFYMGEYMICHEQGFSQLRDMEIIGLPNLKYWRVDEGSMPNLSSLQIMDCDSLVMVPYGLRFIKSLKYLGLFSMPQEICDRVRVVDGHEGVDYYKIQHVPSIDA